MGADNPEHGYGPPGAHVEQKVAILTWVAGNPHGYPRACFRDRLVQDSMHNSWRAFQKALDALENEGYVKSRYEGKFRYLSTTRKGERLVLNRGRGLPEWWKEKGEGEALRKLKRINDRKDTQKPLRAKDVTEIAYYYSATLGNLNQLRLYEAIASGSDKQTKAPIEIGIHWVSELGRYNRKACLAGLKRGAMTVKFNQDLHNPPWEIAIDRGLCEPPTQAPQRGKRARKPQGSRRKNAV